MTKKKEKEYQDEIRALNSYILEMNDQNKAIGQERDRYKELAEKLVEKCLLHGVSMPKGTVCELTEWNGGDETHLCDCGKGEGHCKKQTEY